MAEDRAAMKRAVQRVLKNEDIEIHPKFPLWVADNWDILFEFIDRTFMIAKRRERYSAYTVRESIRWDTDLREKDSVFKINNCVTPDIARVCNALLGRELYKEHARRIYYGEWP